MDAGLASLHEKYPEIVVLKVDIRNWNTPVCQQYQLDSVPYLMLYDGKGRKLGEGDEAQAKVVQILNRRRR